VSKYTSETIRAMKTSDLLALLITPIEDHPVVRPFAEEAQALAAKYAGMDEAVLMRDPTFIELHKRGSAELDRVMRLAIAEIDRRIPIPEGASSKVAPPGTFTGEF